MKIRPSALNLISIEWRTYWPIWSQEKMNNIIIGNLCHVNEIEINIGTRAHTNTHTRTQSREIWCDVWLDLLLSLSHCYVSAHKCINTMTFPFLWSVAFLFALLLLVFFFFLIPSFFLVFGHGQKHSACSQLNRAKNLAQIPRTRKTRTMNISSWNRGNSRRARVTHIYATPPYTIGVLNERSTLCALLFKHKMSHGSHRRREKTVPILAQKSKIKIVVGLCEEKWVSFMSQEIQRKNCLNRWRENDFSSFCDYLLFRARKQYGIIK